MPHKNNDNLFANKFYCLLNPRIISIFSISSNSPGTEQVKYFHDRAVVRCNENRIFSTVCLVDNCMMRRELSMNDCVSRIYMKNNSANNPFNIGCEDKCNEGIQSNKFDGFRKQLVILHSYFFIFFSIFSCVPLSTESQWVEI